MHAKQGKISLDRMGGEKRKKYIKIDTISTSVQGSLSIKSTDIKYRY